MLLVEGAWAHSDLRSGEMVLKYGNEIYELWFNQWLFHHRDTEDAEKSKKKSNSRTSGLTI